MIENYGFPYRIEVRGENGVRWQLACQCTSLDDGYARLAEYRARAGKLAPGTRTGRYYRHIRLTDARGNVVEQ